MTPLLGPAILASVMATLPIFPLLHGPTPFHRLDRASSALGVDLWIKRDDLTGFVMGGNKARKLEMLLPDIQASGADWVVSAGSTQSNFLRQLGAGCRMIGVGFSGVVMDMPCDPGAPRPQYLPPGLGGNVQLADVIGYDLVKIPDGSWEELDEGRHELARQREAEGHKVYSIPVGGSTVLGAYGFVRAGQEFLEQGGGDMDWVVTASSSGSTQTGLAYSLAGKRPKVVGIACDPEPELTHDLSDLALAMDDFLTEQGLSLGVRLQPDDFDFRLDWVGEGYNVPSPEGQEATDWLLTQEGILLDPIYSGKAFAGLLSLVRSGEIGGRVCFWHTGGSPTLLAHH